MDADTQRELLGAEDGDYLRRPIPHRTPNSMISSVMELRSIEGIDENIYKRIRPHICVREQGSRTKFNINTSEAKDAFLLSSILGGSDFYETALAIISERPKKGYENMQELRSSQALQNFEGDSVAYDQIVFEPSFLWVEVKTKKLLTMDRGSRLLLIIFMILYLYYRDDLSGYILTKFQ